MLGDLGTPLRLGYNKEFAFGRGVTVTNMRQVKGLEFDVVIALDPTDEGYPVTAQGRRWLYTVTTRAKQQLHFVSDQAPGTLLGATIEAGLVELLERTDRFRRSSSPRPMTSRSDGGSTDLPGLGARVHAGGVLLPGVYPRLGPRPGCPSGERALWNARPNASPRAGSLGTPSASSETPRVRRCVQSVDRGMGDM